MEKAKFIVATNWHRRINDLEATIAKLENLSSDLTGVTIDIDLGETGLYLDDTNEERDDIFDSILATYRLQLQQAEDYFKKI